MLATRAGKDGEFTCQSNHRRRHVGDFSAPKRQVRTFESIDRDTGPVTHAMTAEMFVQHLCAQGLLFSNVVGEHLADNEGELLLHVLMSDLRRWAISTFYNLNDELAVDGLLTILDEALRTGDEAVKNAVAVSFVEDSCPWDSRMAPFIASWPLGLRDEAGRQQSSR